MTIKKLLLLLLIVPLVLTIQSCGKGAGDGYPEIPPGDPVYVKLKPARNAAQTNGCIDFYAEVHDANGKLLANIPVTFTNMSEPLGVILDKCGGIEIHTPVNTDGWGRAKITIMSTTPGFVTVLAQANLGAKPRDRKTVLFSNCDTYDCLVLAPSIQLDADSEPPDGIYNEPQDFIIFDPLFLPDDKANLLATVRNEYGVLIPYNAHVVWGSDHAEATFTRSESYTNENGQAAAQVEFIPASLRETETHVNVWAYSDNVSSFVYPFDIVTFFLQPVFISSIDVSADPSVVQPEGMSTINAVVWLNTGDYAFDGVPVTFRTCDAALCAPEAHCTLCPISPSCGVVDTFAQTFGGEATSDFTAPPIPNTCRVTASANGVYGSVDILVTAMLTVQPVNLDVDGAVGTPAGSPATYTITGGVSPYTVTADTVDPNLQPNPADVVNSGDSFTVDVPAGTPDITVTYTIMDAVGDTVEATLTISANPLIITPPSLGVLSSGAVQTFTDFYTITGGLPPYIVSSSDPASVYNTAIGDGIWNVAASGDTFTINIPAGVCPGTVTLDVSDSVATTTQATITITAVPLDVAPSASAICDNLIALCPLPGGDNVNLTINGGAAPYDVTSSDNVVITDPGVVPGPAPAVFNVNANDFTVPVTTTVTVTLTVTDFCDTSQTATVDVFGN